MKFAQYLQDTQTPEWKKAYIDYRGLKKRITAIRKAQQGLSFHVSDPDSSPIDSAPLPGTPRPSTVGSSKSRGASPSILTPSEKSINDDNDSKQDQEARSTSVDRRRPSLSIQREKRSFRAKLPSLKLTKNSQINDTAGGTRRPDPLVALPLHELLTYLTPHEVSFFTLLDTQLDKVESFYLEREKEMLSRGQMLQWQLRELQDHRRLFHKAHSRLPWAGTIKAALVSTLTRPVAPAVSVDANFTPQPHTKEESTAAGSTTPDTGQPPFKSTAMGKRPNTEEDAVSHSEDFEDNASLFKELKDRQQQLPLSSDPDSYVYAKRKLKKAVLEHYRGLEVLHNYRVLNITGFRKALKKFEKVTKISAQNQYMTEKVDQSAFASDKAILDMMSQMEELFATAFSRGDRKKALRRLRAGGKTKSHHFSTFRTGVLLGLAVPAFVEGLVRVFEKSTRESFPSWSVLLYFYGVILVPVLFSLLVGFNLLVWVNSRINYVFIFELNALHRLDHREFFEVPIVLLSTLCYAFWLSFSLIGAPTIDPSIWLVIWLAITFVVVFQPLPVMSRSARYWFLRNIGLQFVSGSRRVEFKDFWLGDQLCSLSFTLSNLYPFACVYARGFPSSIGQCGTGGSQWGVAYVLAALPLFIRLVQSIRRYADSKLVTHLINGGKYGTGIITYFFYYYWRHYPSSKAGFALYCLFSVSYSVYAGLWDLLMDWSLLRIHNTKYPLLRPELIYSRNVSVYYFAMVSNIVLRFFWVIYIPHKGPNIMLRSFIAGMVEMLRRVQWNFFRLENEHLGNMDQYRVTREVPLPYSLDEVGRDDDDDGDDDVKGLRSKKR